MSNLVEEYVSFFDYCVEKYRDSMGISVKWGSISRQFYVAVHNNEGRFDNWYANELQLPLETYQGILISYGGKSILGTNGIVFKERKDAQKARDALAQYCYFEYKKRKGNKKK